MDLKSRRFESNKKYRAKLKAQKLQQLSSPSLSSQSFEVSTESVDDNLTTTSTALPAAMPAMSTISLDMLIGDTADIQCNVQYVAHRDLNIATFTYSPADQSRVPKGYVIAIHGGPAFCHNYLLPLQLLVRDGYTVIFYDQAGCGKSSFVTDPESEAPWLLSIQYYLDELQEIINFFKLDRYFLYGSSWVWNNKLKLRMESIDADQLSWMFVCIQGTIVCQEFAVKLPRGLLGLLLDGALSDAELYIRTQWRDRISTLPTLTQKLLKYCIDNGDFSSPMYKELNDTVSKHFTCRAIPSVACYHESFAGMNPVIYTKMQGECEFMIGGVLKNWSITDRYWIVQL